MSNFSFIEDGRAAYRVVLGRRGGEKEEENGGI